MLPKESHLCATILPALEVILTGTGFSLYKLLFLGYKHEQLLLLAMASSNSVSPDYEEIYIICQFFVAESILPM